MSTTRARPLVVGPGPDGEAVAGVRGTLERWAREAGPLPAAQESLRRTYLGHLDVPGSLRKGSPDHLTASALVLDPTASLTLLVLHRRGGFWVQPGGHLEAGDAGTAGGALRELLEETGLPRDAVDLDDLPADLDHHRLGTGFGACRSHLDVAHLAVADPAARLRRSDESADVRWWPLDGLPDGSRPAADGGLAVVADLPPRLARAAAVLRGRRTA